METPSKWFWCLGSVLGFSLLALLFLPVSVQPGCTGRLGSAMTTEAQIVAAIHAYESEYGHPPGVRADGRYDDPSGNAELFRILRGLDAVQNPRNLVYFEANNASPRRHSILDQMTMSNGFDPSSGVLYDPFGSYYRIRLTPRTSGQISMPYEDSPPPHGNTIVWSVGQDGHQGHAENPLRFQGSDDVLSWSKP